MVAARSARDNMAKTRTNCHENECSGLVVHRDSGSTVSLTKGVGCQVSRDFEVNAFFFGGELDVLPLMQVQTYMRCGLKPLGETTRHNFFEGKVLFVFATRRRVYSLRRALVRSLSVGKR